jgi:hypothetical protein
MSWINPLDRVPQIPRDWANHIIYGGALGLIVQLVGSSGAALAVVFAISAAKKIVDYYKENETWQMCVGKTIVSCLWPLSIWVQ